MVFYDYIDIGINDNYNDDIKRGIIIDQNKNVLDKFKNIINCVKLNMCVSNYEGNDNITYLEEKNEVYVITLYQILNNFNIDGLYKLNIKSNEIIILNAFFEENKNNLYLPHIIISKNNISFLNGIKNYYDYDNLYYRLNLKKIKNKRTFTKSIKNYYITNDDDNNYYNTLDSAKEYCIKNNCSGITFHNNIYQVRNGFYIYYNNDNNIYSWIYI